MVFGSLAGLGQMLSTLPPVPAAAAAAPAMGMGMTSPVIPSASSLGLPATPGPMGGSTAPAPGGFSNFMQEFGQGMFGKSNTLGVFGPNLPGKGDSLAAILGKILGGTKMSFNSGSGSSFGFDGPNIRKQSQTDQLMQMLGTRIMDPSQGIVRSNQPADATTNVR